jgi:hypothetical protein
MKHITTNALAKEWGCSDRFIREEIKRGNLNGEKVGNTWLVLKDKKLSKWEANPRRKSKSKAS